MVGRAALAAAREALLGAGLGTRGGGPRTGVVLGVGLGGLHAWERAVLAAERGASVSPADSVASSPAAAPAEVARLAGATGPCRGVSTACAGGTDAIGDAAALIRRGRCDVVLAGGVEAGATATNAAGLRRSGALSAAGAARPFDAGRDGLVLAEGAAVLVLEEAGYAAARGARPLAEILGAASACDAGHPTAPRADGAMLAACGREALDEAGVAAGDLAAVDAHATGTRAGDAAEARALDAIFGGALPPVVATKGATGHAMAAAGALDAVVAVLALQRGLLPPVAGLRTVDPELGLDPACLGLADSGASREGEFHSNGARAFAPGPVLSLSAGFGGYNAALVLAPI